ncbi:hypothetical protein SNE25_14960 [Mucilaginibacter sabulilitoris]|uniref:Adenylosuccinate lyase n=1 Tax=Mucilaginibacter sabulilitoris TaxID=1173583 RepID=A0ABZ0TUQ0_9SPHI|nr:hypothetical protein [Mucilaginibacter sabulilitoris]WPU96821.1 hypothetical protein SNE25_14960 [Mucilaginibacter sabulilitoris]
MNQAELIKQLSSSIGKQRILKLSRVLRELHYPLRDVIDITFHPDKAVAFRAVWLLENVLLTDPESYLDDLRYLIQKFKEVKHQGCMRHYAKITMHITDAKAPQSLKLKLKEIDFEPVVEQLFDWMINPKIKVAVKMFAGSALFNLKDTFPWVKEELADQLEFLMRDGSPAIQTGGKKILKEIKK